MSDITAIDSNSEWNIPFQQTYRSIELVNAEGEKYIITSMVTELNIFEDIFSNTISGSLVFVDAIGASDRMKLRGNERLKVELNLDPNNSVVENKDFYIYALRNRMHINNTSEIYTLHFVSVEAILNEHTRVYSAIEGPNSNSVKVLFDYVGSQKKLTTEETNGSYKFVMPNWTPFEGINWYCGRSISSESRGSYFLFFETMEGFNFKSVESMINKQPVMEYRYEPAGGVFLQKDVTNIREFEVIENTDSLKGTAENYTTLWSHDLVRKKVIKQRFEYEENNRGKLNTGDLLGTSTKNGFDLDLKERRDLYGTNVLVKYETQKTHSQTQAYYHDAIQTKLSAMRQFGNVKIRFLAFGTRKVKAGDVIDMRFLKTQLITEGMKEESADKLLSGRYLVTAVRLVMKQQDFHIAVEAVKDSREG